MKHGKIALKVVLLLLQLCSSRLLAWPTTAYQAEKVVTGWLQADAQPLGMPLGWPVIRVETFTDERESPVYYIVYLQHGGFVIVPADDFVEPIIGFADDGTYDPSLDNPLGALVSADLNERIAVAREVQTSQASSATARAFESRVKWRRLESWADSPAITGLPSISDICVAPLVQSRWSQGSVCGSICYNYYTPNNYVCGCVATAIAQLMRYHRHPTGGIGRHGFTIRVDGDEQTAYTRGGDGSGGAYNWTRAVLVPDCDTTPAQRQAIGALCYDAGVCVNMSYSSSGSGADTLRAKDALTTIFQYENAIKGYRAGNDIGEGLVGMINPNLGGKYPVLLGIRGNVGGHAVVCDGYGYHNSVMYHHLNMGWAGNDDAWYDLPNIDSSPAFTSVYKCVYNVRISEAGDGEMISGRVLEANGEPIANATVYAIPQGQAGAETVTDGRGIYAFDGLSSNTTYTVRPLVAGYVFSSETVTTGVSSDYASISGNIWGIDFVGVLGPDFSEDGKVDFEDYSLLAQYWRQGESSVDIAPPPSGDGTVDFQDLATFTGYWLRVTPPGPASNPNPANGAAGVSALADLSWKAGAYVVSHDVYFGKSDPPPFIRNQTATTFDPGIMTTATTYYWRIDEVNSWGKTTGRLWSFTTGGPPPP